MEKLLRRKEASEYLAEIGVIRAPATLAKYAVLGIGPSFQYLDRIPVYTPAALDEWVGSLLSAPTRTSSKPAPPANADR